MSMQHYHKKIEHGLTAKVLTMTAEYQEGYSARIHGVHITDNPYDGIDMWHLMLKRRWRIGWEDAHSRLLDKRWAG